MLARGRRLGSKTRTALGRMSSQVLTHLDHMQRPSCPHYVPLQKFSANRCYVLFAFTFSTCVFLLLTAQLGENEGLLFGTSDCGDVCSLRYRRKVGARYYPLLTRNVQCMDVMGRMARARTGVRWPPVRYPPPEVMGHLTQLGDMPLRDVRYFPAPDRDARKQAEAREASGSPLSLGHVEEVEVTADHLTDMAARASQGEKIMPPDDRLAEDLLVRYLQANANRIYNGSCLVLGQKNPWLEAIVLAYGARTVVSVEYQIPNYIIRTAHPQVLPRSPTQFALDYLKGEAPAVQWGVMFCSADQLGLGRFGEQLNAWADLEALAQAWCLLPSGARLFLVVHYDKGKQYLVWNAYRVYGIDRLQFLTANWKVVDFRPVDTNRLTVGLITDVVENRYALLVLDKL